MALPTGQTTDRADAPAAVRWDPVVELEQLNRRLARYLDLWRHNASLFDGLLTPPVDVEETDGAYVVDIELPGVSEQDVDIDIAGDRLIVRGERKEKKRVGVLRRRERRVGRFQYKVMLPGNGVEDGMVANLGDGVLTVRVPKPENERLRRIDVH